MPQGTPSERLEALKAKGPIKRPSKLERAYEIADHPLLEFPQRWGNQLADYIQSGDEGPSVFDSPYTRMMRGARNLAAGASRLGGGVASGLTSPLNIGLTAATLGAAAPEVIGANASRASVLAARGLGAAQAAHGGTNIYRGVKEGNTGKAVTGGIEALTAIPGLRTRFPEYDIKLDPSLMPSKMPLPVTERPTAPEMVRPTNTMETTTKAAYDAEKFRGAPQSKYPTSYQRLLTQGSPSTAQPVRGSVVTPGPGRTFTAGKFGVSESGPLGVVEKGTVTGGPPIQPDLTPRSAGMQPGSSFEALVPDRFKTAPTPPPRGVSGEGLSLNYRGEPPVAPTAGLRTLDPSGKLKAPSGTVTLEQMVERYGLEEAAARARMTPGELVETLSAKKVSAPKKAPAPPKAKVEVKVEPKAEVPPVDPKAAKLANETRQVTPEARAAAKERLTLRQRLRDETGAVGPGAEDLMRRRIQEPVSAPLETPQVLDRMPPEFSPDIKQIDRDVLGGTSPTFFDRLKQTFTDETGAIGDVSRVRAERAAAQGGFSIPSRRTPAPNLAEEAIAQNPSLFAKAFDAANQLRMTSMLSGLAPIKSALGNIGSPFIAAAENPGMARDIFREALNVPENLRNVAKGWSGEANPAMLGGFGKMNIPGRVMGALDYATQKGLERGGLTEDMAKELLLTKANRFAAEPALKTAVGQALVPFRTIPVNQFLEGISRYKKHPGIYAGAAGLGFGAGALTEDPKKLSLASATMGPYALPFLAGASVKAGAHALQGISPIPEWSITKTLTEPGAPFGFGKDPEDSNSLPVHFDPSNFPAKVWWEGLGGTKSKKNGPNFGSAPVRKRRALSPEGY